MSLKMLSVMGGVLVVLIVAFFYSLVKVDRLDLYDKVDTSNIYRPSYQISDRALGHYCDALIKRDKSGKFLKTAGLLGVNLELLQDQINLLHMENIISAVEILALKIFGLLCGIVICTYAFIVQDLAIGVLGSLIAISLYFLPTEKIKDKLKEREEQIVMELPQFIEQCYMCIEAGATLQEALMTVADNNGGVLGPMFQDAFAKSSYGGRWEDELYHMILEVHVEALEDFVNDILISHKKGTKISDTLRMEVSHIHKISVAKQEEMISKINTKAMLLMLIFAVVPAFIIIVAPMFIQAMEAF